MRYMLDTNVVIHTIRNRPQEARRMFNRHEGDISMSAVTLMELLHGAEKSEQRERNLRDVASFAALLEVLPYDSDAAAHTGRIRAELARLGEPIGPYDTMMAGHARSRGPTVVTANTREFDRVPGLVVENWVASPEDSRKERRIRCASPSKGSRRKGPVTESAPPGLRGRVSPKSDPP